MTAGPLAVSARQADGAADRLLAALHARGAHRIRGIRFKANRSRLLSVSRDGVTLHAHTCFRDAPPRVQAALATFLTAGRHTAAYREAVARIRAWGEANRASEAPAGRARPPRPGPCCATPAERARLAALFHELNRSRFGGRLPGTVPLRLSRRMSRRLGHVRYHRNESGTRAVVELALSADLMERGNEAALRETMLHEMAHIAAWLEHGHAGHGAPWKRIARQVGCEPRACTRAPIARRAASGRVAGRRARSRLPADPASGDARSG